MQDRREFPEAWDRLVNQVRSAQQVHLDLMVDAVRQVHKAVRDYLAALENAGRPVPPVRPESRVQMALLALRDRPAHLAPPVLKAPAVQPDQLGWLVLRARRAWLDRWERRERQVLQAR